MAIWERPQVLSGEAGVQQAEQNIKPVVGLCIIHQDMVSMEWAMMFKHFNVGYPYVYFYNKNMPYDCAREQVTRACLEKDVEWIFHLDSDVCAPQNTIPTLIELAKQNDKPVVSGLYWAKKREETPMPAAWIQTGEDLEHGKVFYQSFDVKPYLDKNALIACDVIGAGCMLVKADIFRKLEESDPKKPFFQWGVGRHDENTGKPLLQVSEDFYFCHRLKKELNIVPHLSTAVRCDHITLAERQAADGKLVVAKM